MGEEEEDVRAGPLEDRLESKSWKVRMYAYEDLENLFKSQTEETSSVYAEYGRSLPQYVSDKNAPAQEKALDAYAMFLLRASKSHVERYSSPVCAKIVEHTFTQRVKNKDKGVETFFLHIEAEGSIDAVVSALVEGVNHKQPKVAVISLAALRGLIAAFGARAFPLKVIFKIIPPLFEKKDSGVRTEAMQLVVEICRWIGNAILSQLEDLRPAQLKDLEAALTTIDTAVKPQPTRFTRSKLLALQQSNASQDSSSGRSAAAVVVEEEVDPYEFLTPKDVMSLLTSAFWEGLEAAKWSERKEKLDELYGLLTCPKLAEGEYGELTKALRKIVEKDLNVMCVARSVDCIAKLAEGLRGHFSKECRSVLPALLDKAKDKNKAIQAAIGKALDMIWTSGCILLGDYIEDIVSHLNHKVPSARLIAMTWLDHCMRTPQKRGFGLKKDHIRPLALQLLKSFDDVDSQIRNVVASVFALLIHICGERLVSPYLDTLDNIRQKKVQDCYAELRSSSSSSSSSSAATTAITQSAAAPAKTVTASVPSSSSSSSSSTSSKPSSSSSSSATSSSHSRKMSDGKVKIAKEDDETFGTVDYSAVEERIQEVSRCDFISLLIVLTILSFFLSSSFSLFLQIIPAAIRTQLASPSWMERSEGLHQLKAHIGTQLFREEVNCTGV